MTPARMLPCLVDNKDNPSEISPTKRDVFTTQCIFRHIAQFCCIFDGTYAARPFVRPRFEVIELLAAHLKIQIPQQLFEGYEICHDARNSATHCVCSGEKGGGGA